MYACMHVRPNGLVLSVLSLAQIEIELPLPLALFFLVGRWWKANHSLKNVVAAHMEFCLQAQVTNESAILHPRKTEKTCFKTSGLAQDLAWDFHHKSKPFSVSLHQITSWLNPHDSTFLRIWACPDILQYSHHVEHPQAAMPPPKNRSRMPLANGNQSAETWAADV